MRENNTMHGGNVYNREGCEGNGRYRVPRNLCEEVVWHDNECQFALFPPSATKQVPWELWLGLPLGMCQGRWRDT